MISCDPLTAGRVSKDGTRDHRVNVIVHLPRVRERRKLRKNESLRKEKRVILTEIAEGIVTRSHGTHPTAVKVKKMLHLHQLNASDIHLLHRQSAVKSQRNMLSHSRRNPAQFLLRSRNQALG